MKLKKWLAVLLALMMLLSLLAGCAKDDDDDDDDDEKSSQTDKNKDDKDEDKDSDQDEDKDSDKDEDKDEDKAPTKAPVIPTPAPTEAPTVSVDGVAIGTILDKPEKVFADDSDELYLNVTVNEAGTKETMGIGILANADDSVVIYFNDGPAKTAEYVIEIAADGAIAGYVRADGAAAFVADTESTAAEILNMAEEMLAVIDVVTLDPEVAEGVKYKKMASANASVYTYALVEDGEESGTVNIDKATGIAVLMQDEGMSITVDTIDQKDARIPAYKTAAPTIPTTPATPTTPTTPAAPSVDGVAIGTILDKPEVVFADESDQMYLSLVVKEGSNVQKMGIGMKANADDSVVIYFNDGPAKTAEYVIEIAADGTISGYTRAQGMTAFAADTVNSAEEILNLAEEMLGILEALSLDETITGDIKYKKIAPITAETGPVYSYTMIEDGQENGKVSVDKASGLAVYLEDSVTTITVNTLDLKNAQIPAYK